MSDETKATCPKCGAAIRSRDYPTATYDTFECESTRWLDGLFDQSIHCFAAQLQAANAEIARLRADAARLDWLEKRFRFLNAHSFIGFIDRIKSSTIRDEIDKAMK